MSSLYFLRTQRKPRHLACATEKIKCDRNVRLRGVCPRRGHPPAPAGDRGGEHHQHSLRTRSDLAELVRNLHIMHKLDKPDKLGTSLAQTWHEHSLRTRSDLAELVRNLHKVHKLDRPDKLGTNLAQNEHSLRTRSDLAELVRNLHKLDRPDKLGTNLA